MYREGGIQVKERQVGEEREGVRRVWKIQSVQQGRPFSLVSKSRNSHLWKKNPNFTM